MERGVSRGEQLSTLEFDMTVYIGDPDSDEGAIFAVRPDGSGLRQIGKVIREPAAAGQWLNY